MSVVPLARGHHHVVSTGHELATLAAFEALENGGNAIDAGVAAILTLGVVYSDQVSVAGVAPMIIRLAETARSSPSLASAAGRGRSTPMPSSNATGARCRSGYGAPWCPPPRRLHPGAGALGHDDLSRRGGARGALRRRRLPAPSGHARLRAQARRRVPPLAGERRDLDARRRGAGAGRPAGPGRSGPHPAVPLR